MDSENDPRLAFLGKKRPHGPVRLTLAIALQAVGCALILFGLASMLRACGDYTGYDLGGPFGVLMGLAGLASLFVGSQLRKT